MPEEASSLIWMRQEVATAGRPPGHSRAEITTAAITIADQEGLAGVSMRRVAAALSTGAASLYRYVDNRDDLLDLMSDATGAEYAYPAPTGDWLTDLLDLGAQAQGILRRHPWLASLVLTRPVLGPNGLALLEYFLATLADHPASTSVKFDAFALFTATSALFVHNELTGGASRQQRDAAYLRQALAGGSHPRLAALLEASAQADPSEQLRDPADRYRDILGRILTGLLSGQPHRA